MLEKEIEKQCVEYAVSFGIIGLKLVDVARKGFPDRSFLVPGGEIFLVEFKLPGEKPSAVQTIYHLTLENLGFKVFVVDCLEDFRSILGVYL